MKKRSEAYLARKAAKRKAAKETRERGPQKSEPLPIVYPRWIRVAKWIGGTLIVGGVSFVASAYQIWGGPPWPVAPVFAPGFPSSGFALDVPFTVTNKSALFPLRHLEILCRLENVKISAQDMRHAFTGLSVTSNGMSNLGPLQSAAYVCPFAELRLAPNAATVTEATINFITKYDSVLPFSKQTKSESDFFSLNTRTVPPQWTAIPVR